MCYSTSNGDTLHIDGNFEFNIYTIRAVSKLQNDINLLALINTIRCYK